MILDKGRTSKDSRRKGEERRVGSEAVKGNSTTKGSRGELILNICGSHEDVRLKVS